MMDSFAVGLVVVAASYLAGSIPFGYLCARFVSGIDIREHGSGNIGATNVGRVLGSRWGLFVLGLDAAKGILPVGGLAPFLLDRTHVDFAHWQVAAGVATIIGHMFPCWLGFRGGKGVATALGVIGCLAGWSTLVAAGVFVATFALWRYVSLSSILAAIAFGVYQLGWQLQPDPFGASHWSLAAFSLLVPLLIVVRHRTNIGRLWRGEEQRYERRRTPAPASPASGDR
jgi:acyl phosphate:glycerol-3-phosphate acyltransferase